MQKHAEASSPIFLGVRVFLTLEDPALGTEMMLSRESVCCRPLASPASTGGQPLCQPLCAGGLEAKPSGELILQGPEGTRGLQAWAWSWCLHEIPSLGETTLGNMTKECFKPPRVCWVTRRKEREVPQTPTRPRRAVQLHA